MEVLYEDNHLIIVNKAAGEIVQHDKTGDIPLETTVKDYIKRKHNKPGDVFLGVVHRIDRPVSGVVLLAKTSKALARMNEAVQQREVKKIYWAIVKDRPEKDEGILEHFLLRNTAKNKSFCYSGEVKDSKKAILHYRMIGTSEFYSLLEIDLKTGRHHQIRAQLSTMGCPIKGDLKYGAARSNPDGSISLHARSLTFIHPVKKEEITVTAPVPDDNLWYYFNETLL